MVANKIVSPIYQLLLYGKTETRKNNIRLGQGVHDIANSHVDGEIQGGINQLKLNTPVLEVSCNKTTHYRYELD